MRIPSEINLQTFYISIALYKIIRKKILIVIVREGWVTVIIYHETFILLVIVFNNFVSRVI